MSLPQKSQQELYDLWKNKAQEQDPTLTDFVEGSELDTLAGAFSLAGIELSRYIILQFNKTFFDLAEGPDENNGGPDDLQTLAVDHFGSAFARPQAVAAVDTATFSRPNHNAGAVTIPQGTIVKTAPDANGTAQRYSTNAPVTLTNSNAPSDLSVSVGITALVAGKAGSATAGTINIIESTLLDPTIVVTNAGNATGEDAQDSPTYRETIRNLITALRAATKAAIEAAALTVPGVVTAKAIETELPVVVWNIAGNHPQNSPINGLYDYFLIPFAQLYVADNTGSASPTLVAEVEAAIDLVRAMGVMIQVLGTSPIVVNWEAKIVLNANGPNFALFSNDDSKIVSSMTSYIQTLGSGVGFVRATAEAAIMAIWGPSGTNDLVSISTVIPTGDISVTVGETCIPGTVKTV